MAKIIKKIAEMIGDDVFTLCDIGARGGVPPEWASSIDCINVVAFEPDREEAEKLSMRFKAQGIVSKVINAAVWSENATKVLYITKSPASSSLLKPRENFLSGFSIANKFEIVSQVNVNVTTLDEVARTEYLKIDFVKIDVQGGSAAVLKGAKKVLEISVGVEVEAELVALYEGSSLIGEIDKELSGIGFEMIDIRPTYWKRKEAEKISGAKGQVIYSDLLYMISPEELIKRLEKIEDEKYVKRMFASVMLSCLVYGLNDRILSYYEYAKSNKINVGDYRFLIKYVNRSGLISKLPEFYGRNFLGDLMKDLADQLHSPRKRIINQDRKLGGQGRCNWFRLSR